MISICNLFVETQISRGSNIRRRLVRYLPALGSFSPFGLGFGAVLLAAVFPVLVTAGFHLSFPMKKKRK